MGYTERRLKKLRKESTMHDEFTEFTWKRIPHQPRKQVHSEECLHREARRDQLQNVKLLMDAAMALLDDPTLSEDHKANITMVVGRT